MHIRKTWASTDPDTTPPTRNLARRRGGPAAFAPSVRWRRGAVAGLRLARGDGARGAREPALRLPALQRQLRPSLCETLHAVAMA